MSFWDGVGQFATNLGESMAAQSPLGQAGLEAAGIDSPDAHRNQQSLMQGMIGRYRRDAGHKQVMDAAAGMPAQPGIPADAMPPVQQPQTPMPEPVTGPYPGADTAIKESATQDALNDPNVRSQWNSGSSGGGGGGLPGGLMALAAERGTVVTQPTIVKLAEHGQAEAVVPLKARAQNHIQPDMLEGHITAPKIPGVRYSRYRSYIDRAI